MKAKTPDERLILAVYEIAFASGDVHNFVNTLVAGQRAGLHPKGTKTICKLLLQANFVRKRGEESIFLTDHGVALVQRLLAE